MNFEKRHPLNPYFRGTGHPGGVEDCLLRLFMVYSARWIHLMCFIYYRLLFSLHPHLNKALVLLCLIKAIKYSHSMI